MVYIQELVTVLKPTLPTAYVIPMIHQPKLLSVVLESDTPFPDTDFII